MKSNYQLLIVGAGAAGIGAAHAARNAGLDVLLVEASHRVGGRGLTEELAPGIPWDCLLYTSPSPRDRTRSRMPSSA